MKNINLAVGSEVTVATVCDRHKRKGKVIAHLHVSGDAYKVVITHDSFGLPVEGGITQLFDLNGKAKGGAVRVIPTTHEYRCYILSDDFIPEWLEKDEAKEVYEDSNNILGILDADYDPATATLSNVRYTTLEG